MISAYEDWDTRRNWYALYIAIMTGKGSGYALKSVGLYKKEPPGSCKPYKSSRRRNKYPKEQIARAMRMRDVDGMKWYDIAAAVNIPYGSLMTIYSREKRKAVNDD